MLTAKNISKNFGEIKVLDKVNLDVEKGSIVSIYGSSGAGKSTLLYILSTLDMPDTGEVFIDDLSISDLKGDKLSDFRNDKIGFIFQFHNLLDEFNVLENVCLPGYVSSSNNRDTENKAKEQAIKYAKIIGQLPNFLRTKNLKTLTIHKGNEEWGGGHNDILIYTDMYQWGEFTEEVAIHEAAHTTLDPQWHGSIKRSKWNKAIKADNKFVSTYAKKYPKKEDIAETFPLCFALEFKRDRLEDEVIQKIENAIPNRIKYCLSVFENNN